MAEITIKATDENLETAQDFVREVAQKVCENRKELLQLDLAVEEIFVNIAHYAYGKSGAGDATIKADSDEPNKSVKIEFIDKGFAFDPTAKPDPDVTLSLDERQIGGLGIFLAKKIMDCIEYRRENDKNILQMKKKF